MLLDLEAQKRRVSISLTPLIDVVFILLLFFMLSSSFIQWRSITVSAPSSTVNDQSVDIIVVRLLSADGRFEMEGKQYSQQDMSSLKGFIQLHPDAVYAIEVEAGLDTQSMISLLDKLKTAGARQVSLAGVMP
jgi:biopolymer transport protein ExbD